MNVERLSEQEHWDQRWSEAAISGIRFDPTVPMYRDMHRRLLRFLPRDANLRFLEIGAYPGYLMWYFRKYFGYRVSGLEYVRWCCEHASALLAREGVEAEVIEGDLFAFECDDRYPGWDVVASSGFIEHFTDPAEPIARHLRLLRRGGYLVLVVPNHATVYGKIMKKVAPEKFSIHNRMTLDDALSSLHRAGPCKLVFSGYMGRLGFWNSCLYEVAKKRTGRAYPLVRAPLWALEHAGQWLLPNTAFLSPSFLVIAQKA
jgi:SAM-dependent methyltransferase